MVWQKDSHLQKRLEKIIKAVQFFYVNPKRVFVFRSFGSKSRAQARIWGFPRIWQEALDIEPSYCLEVISEKFDKLDQDTQNKILIHELLHIPKNFSGSLLSHSSRGRRINRQIVEKLFAQYAYHSRK